MIALADLAREAQHRLVSLSEIAERQDISLAYLEQLFVKLRRAEIVESVRGPGGGYRLARGGDAIRGWCLGRGVGQPCAKFEQPVVGRAFGACLCVFAPDAAFGCHRKPARPMPRRARLCYAGG